MFVFSKVVRRLFLYGLFFSGFFFSLSAQAEEIYLGSISPSGGVLHFNGSIAGTQGAAVDINDLFSFSLTGESALEFETVDIGIDFEAFEIYGFEDNLVASFEGLSGSSFTTGLLTAGDYAFSVNGTTSGVFGGIYRGSISTVPIPAAAWLFGSAVIGLAGISRRRNQTVKVA